MQRLRTTQYGGHSLQRHAHHVHVGLLRRQRRSGGLGVKPHHHRPRVLRAEAFLHDVRVEPPRRAVLGDLLQKIAMRVEEERHSRRERVDIQPGA